MNASRFERCCLLAIAHAVLVALYTPTSHAQIAPLEFTTGLQAVCRGKVIERPFSIRFQVSDKNYEKQIEAIWSITNSGECRLTPDAQNHLTRAIGLSRQVTNSDFYVAVKMMINGTQEPWADVYLDQECLLMRGDDGYAFKTHFQKAVRDINEYSSKLRKLALSNLERISIIGRMDVINGRLAACAAGLGDDITEALIDDSAFLVTTAQVVVERELAGRRADTDHVIVSSQKGGGSAPPFFPKGFFKK